MQGGGHRITTPPQIELEDESECEFLSGRHGRAYAVPAPSRKEINFWFLKPYESSTVTPAAATDHTEHKATALLVGLLAQAIRRNLGAVADAGSLLQFSRMRHAFLQHSPLFNRPIRNLLSVQDAGGRWRNVKILWSRNVNTGPHNMTRVRPTR